MECSTCSFYESKDSTCRVNPPVALMQPDGEVVSVFPNVVVDDWCADHTQDESSNGG